MTELNPLLLDLYEGAQFFSVHDFSEYSLKAIKRRLQFDSASLVDYAVTGQHRVGIQTIHLHQTPIERLHQRVSYAGEETLTAKGTLVSRDNILQAAIANRGRSVTADVRQAFHKSSMLDYCHRFDNAHSLVIASPTREGSFSLAAFWRADQKKAYSNDDVALSTYLLPHLLRAKQINQQLAIVGSANNDSRVNSVRAIIMATFDGRLYTISSMAIALLQREWKQWLPPVLPAKLMDTLASNARRRFVGTALTISASIQGNLLCLELAALSGADMLTPAEDKVAHLAAKGLQYKEIAKCVGAAPATVRNHLQAVYRKLGVTNKTALATAISSR